VTVEVGGKRIAVTLPATFGSGVATGSSATARRPKRRTGGGASGSATGGDGLTSPMQGTIVKIAVADGDQVDEGDLIVVLEAMKMEQPLNAHKAGTVTGLTAEVGATVASGSVICEIKD
jgi:acetyl-CoA/propionyl-CoA carboxylase biotin carboxyl carrier protein